MIKKHQVIKAPVYKQIADILKELIKKNTYKVGDKFPSEREISERFDVSRATANKAISALISEGFLIYKKGVGTYVSKPKLNYELGSLISFTEKVKNSGLEPSTEVLVFKEVLYDDIPDYIIEQLNLIKNEKVYYMERLRKADNIPVILEYRYLKTKYCPDLNKNELNGSLYKICLSRYNLQLTGIKQSIKIIDAEEQVSNIMAIENGKSCLQINGTGYINYNIPLWVEHTIYNPDSYEFTIFLGHVNSD